MRTLHQWADSDHDPVITDIARLAAHIFLAHEASIVSAFDLIVVIELSVVP